MKEHRLRLPCENLGEDGKCMFNGPNKFFEGKPSEARFGVNSSGILIDHLLCNSPGLAIELIERQMACSGYMPRRRPF